MPSVVTGTVSIPQDGGSITQNSALDFIRALKASSDPPQVPGPTKIEIAQEAWINSSLYMPNKAETIVDWLLTRLLKDRTKEFLTNPLLDLRYWKLLDQILSTHAGARPRDKRTHAWLIPLLSRIPIAPIVVSFVSPCSQSFDVFVPTLEVIGCRCLSVLWPLASPKFSPETLLECFATLLSHLSSRVTNKIATNDGLLSLASLIVSSYRSSLANTSNKKKLYTSFIKTHLRPWLECTTGEFSMAKSQTSLPIECYDAGIETLFSVDALRSSQEQHAEAAFEKALANVASTRPEIVLACLPRLFRSYRQAQTRHRAALYGQSSKQTAGSATEQTRLTIMSFFALCESLLSQMSESSDVWRSRAALLSIVDQEGLLNSTDESSVGILRRIGELAINSLSSVGQGNKELVEIILITLSALTRIDYDLVPFALSRVLPILVTAPPGLSSSAAYLQHLLDYHTKTRTMDAYVTASLQAFKNLLSAGDIRVYYGISSSGPLFQHTYLDSLSRSIRNFLTPGQVMETVKAVILQLTVALEECENLRVADADRPKKKRRLDSPSAGGSLATVKLALMFKSAAVIMTALPLHSLLPDARLEVQRTIQEMMTRFASESLKKAFKAAQRNEGDTWDSQILITSVLHFRYSVVTTSDFQLLSVRDNKLVSKMLSCVRARDTLSELRVEMLRSLLYEASRGHCDTATVFGEVLSCIDNDGSQSRPEWTGELHMLDDAASRSPLGVAVLHLLFDRWLALFHQFASNDQILRLAKSILSVGGDIENTLITSTLTRGSEFRRLLQNAEFWELGRLRDALLTQVSEQTSPLDSINTVDILTAKGSLTSSSLRLPLDIDYLRARYEVLLYTPQECLSREIRNDLVRRALVADTAISCGAGGATLTKDHLTLLVYLREFIKRAISQLGSVEHSMMGQYLFYLVDLQTPSPESEPRIGSITMDLIARHISAILSTATKGQDAELAALVQFFLDVLAVASSRPSTLNTHHAMSLMLLFDLLTNDKKVLQFSHTVLQPLRQLHEQLFIFLLPQVTEKHEEHWKTPILSLWWRLLALRRWMNTDASQTPLVAMATTTRLFSFKANNIAVDTCTAILSIALEELHLPIQDRPLHLEFIVAAYLSFSRNCDDRSPLDACLSGTSKYLQVPDFDAILSIIIDGLGDETLGSEDLSNLIRLLSVIVHDSPEGSLRAVQNHTPRCLGLFVNRSVFVSDSSLTLGALGFISKHFNDRPAAIRSIDATTTWSFITHCLGGSSSHDERTNAAIFQEIVSIVSGLVRLRRDLVLSTLPLLGFTLHKLILSLRTLPANLGAAQSKLVSDTLPKWVNATDPVTAEESKALARLLTTLMTKTIVRTHANPSTEVQKADSLARPFSKHASHVLAAYLAALNDPLCVMPSVIRKELEPGLFVLCDIMGEQNRDALMVMLNAGEKAVMKGLWRAYEKQRYVGKG